MKRKEQSKPLYESVIKDGFRKELDHYFPKYMLTYKKQISPFIVVTETEIKKIIETKELLSFSDGTTVFHTWPGERRSDVFVFTIKQFKEWLNSQTPEYKKYYEKVL